jgi:hypothetical protein
MAKKRGKSSHKKVSPLSNKDKSDQFHKLPGASRQYQRGKSGKVISRRQYDTLRKREGKEFSRPITPVFKAEKGTHKYWNAVHRFKEVQELKAGSREIANSSEFRTARKNLSSKDLRAFGPKARALEAFGLRERDASYAVGETPKAE